MWQYTAKMEVNVTQRATAAQDLNNFGSFIMKNRIPVVVVEPQFIDSILLERSRLAGPFKIIVAVDFDTGKSYAMDKIKFLPKNALNCDGLDILLTQNRSEMESFNELKAITEFIRKINPTMEIRWTLGLHTRKPETIKHLPHLVKHPGNLIRTESCCELPQLKINHQEDIDLIKKYCATPVKLCGNIDFPTIKEFLNKAARFDVSVQQAKRIIKVAQEEDSAPAPTPAPATPAPVPEPVSVPEADKDEEVN